MHSTTQEDAEASSSSSTPVAGPSTPFNASELAALARLGGRSKDDKGGLGFGIGPGSDELNLAGLLNVLDGVVDAPGRLVVMTTNHPEKLDPALIRPGRINKKVRVYLSGHTLTPAIWLLMEAMPMPAYVAFFSEAF